MADRISQMTMHRMKKLAIKTREEMMSERSREESASSRFSRGIETGVRYGTEDSVRAGSAAVKKAYRQYGEKKLRARDKRVKYADREIMQTEAEIRSEGRVRIAALSNETKARETAKQVSASNLKNSPKSVNLRKQIYTRQRNYTILKLRRERSFGANRRIFSNSGFATRDKRRGIKEASQVLKRAAKATKTLVTAIVAAGSSAVLIILICIFLSASVFLFGQDTKVEYSAEALGVGDTLIMRVASAQLGNVGGLKFCKWYGFNGRVEWCACFVSWCANQCGYIEKGIIPKFAAVGDGVDWFKARGRFRNNKYIPHPGDVIFFDWGADGTRDHVGFVERCDGKMVYTIEGNSGDACKRLAYRVGSSVILGYGVPAYPVTQGAQKLTKNDNDKNKLENKPNVR